MTDDGGRKSKKIKWLPGDGLDRTSRATPVNDDLPESLIADVVFTDLTAHNSATNPVCLAEMDRSRAPIAA